MEGMQPTQSPEQARLKQLENEATAFWNQGKQEGEPQIKFKIVFGSHVGSKDLDIAKKDFAECDVYVPEDFGHEPGEVSALEQLSWGGITPELVEKGRLKNNPNWRNSLNHGYATEMVKMVYKSRKPFMLIDVESSHELTAGKAVLNQLFFKMTDSVNLEEKKVLVRELLNKYAAHQREREKYMFSQIPSKMKELLTRRPELRRKPELKVLISLGAYHTFLFHMMHEANSEMTTRSFPKLPYKFNLTGSAERAIAFGKIKPENLSEEMVARIVVETDFIRFFQKSIGRAGEKDIEEKFDEKVTEYIKMFSLEEIEELYRRRKEGYKFRDLFLELLKKKGIQDISL